jgi:peroxin-5
MMGEPLQLAELAHQPQLIPSSNNSAFGEIQNWAAGFSDTGQRLQEPAQNITGTGDWASDFRPTAISSMPMMLQNSMYGGPTMQLQQQNQFFSSGTASQVILENRKEWAEAFEQRANQFAVETPQAAQENAVIDGKEANDLIAKAAGKIIDILKDEENPKFKNSAFMGMMKSLRDKELIVEGNKVVQPISQNDKKSELPKSEHYLAPAIPSAFEMAQEFAGQKLNWERDNSLQSPPRIWSGQIPTSADVSHDIDMSDNSRSIRKVENLPEEKWMNDHNIDFDSIQEARAYKQETANSSVPVDMDLQGLMEQKIELENDWMNLSKDWRDHSYDDSQLDSSYFEYRFTDRNPYTSLSTEGLSSFNSQYNLTESILVTEALLERNPPNAHELWFKLGKMQQENENEIASIAALNKAVSINPDYLEPYLYLAISYTNENLLQEAYQSVWEWLNRNGNYKTLFPTGVELPTSIVDRHDALVKYLVQAAMSNPGENLDPDVQTALGILFNISAEYDKAVDCFKAALAKNPGDYQLWNRLG